MDSSTKEYPKHPNIFEFGYQTIKRNFKTNNNIVECINQQNMKVEPLDPFKPLLRFNKLQNKIVAFILVFIIFSTDSNILPFLYKIWLISFISLLYIIKCDLDRIPIRYIHPSKIHTLSNNNSSSNSNSSNSNNIQPTENTRIIELQEEQLTKEYISVSQCEFHILQVKVIDQNENTNTTSSGNGSSNSSSSIQTPITVGVQQQQQQSKAIFQITILCGRSR